MAIRCCSYTQGVLLWWYGQARKVTYILIDDHDDRCERSEHDGTARPPSTAVPYIPVTQRGRPSDPIRSQRSKAAGPSNGRSNESWWRTTESISAIKLEDRGERAQGRERKKGQAQKEEVRHEGVNRGLGHGRVLLVRVAGEGARAPSTSECSSRIGEGQ